MRATLLLEDNNSSLTEIAHAVGFYDYSHFYHNFSKKYNISPYAYRKQHIQKHIIHPTHKN